MEYRAHYESPLGRLLLASDGKALTRLQFSAEQYNTNLQNHPVLTKTCRWLDTYFRGERPDFMPPLTPEGTPFQQTVWRELQTISYGHTLTYGDLARRIGCRSAQAVGGAVGRNPIAILIPCHRIVGADGSLTGYAYGLHRKQHLLQIEQTNHGKQS